jgi:uncharacterized protein (TIGR02145 family)
MASTWGWTTSPLAGTIGNDQASNNDSGFTALPGGARSSGSGGFFSLGVFGIWWAYDSWNVLYVIYNESTATQYTYAPEHGLSVRCVKDN